MCEMKEESGEAWRWSVFGRVAWVMVDWGFGLRARRISYFFFSFLIWSACGWLYVLCLQQTSSACSRRVSVSEDLGTPRKKGFNVITTCTHHLLPTTPPPISSFGVLLLSTDAYLLGLLTLPRYHLPFVSTPPDTHSEELVVFPSHNGRCH
jgi:hypothetical protein